MMKKLFITALMFAASVGLTNAQTAQKQIVEEGGTRRTVTVAPIMRSMAATTPKP